MAAELSQAVLLHVGRAQPRFRRPLGRRNHLSSSSRLASNTSFARWSRNAEPERCSFTNAACATLGPSRERGRLVKVTDTTVPAGSPMHTHQQISLRKRVRRVSTSTQAARARADVPTEGEPRGSAGESGREGGAVAGVEERRHLTRRECGGSVVVAAAAAATLLSGATCPQEASAGGLPVAVAGSTPDSMWMAQLPPGTPQGVYSDVFVQTLTRFLVVYDDALRSWWTAQADLVLPSLTARARLAQRSAQLNSLASSVRAGLVGRFPGKQGAEALFAGLIESYGEKGPAATQQLCGLFAMLDARFQPTGLIAAQLQLAEGDSAEEEGPGADMAGEPATPRSVPSSTSALTAHGKASPLSSPPPPASSAPFVVFPEDGRLLELPQNLQAYRIAPDGPFKVSTGGFDFSFGGRVPGPGTLVTRERMLGWDTYLRFFASGAVASGTAHAALTPVDMLKTRLQTQPEKYGDGPVAAAATILEEEGAGAFAQGLGPTAAGYFIAGAIAFGGTEYFKRAAVQVLGPQAVLANPFPVILACGSLAITLCCLFVAPFEATRIRLVDNPAYAPSLPQALLRVATEEGGDIYRGLPVLLIKDIPFHATKFAVFDSISTALRSPTFTDALPLVTSPGVLTALAGTMAGIAAAVVSQPADATFTRCNRQKDTMRGRGEARGSMSPAQAFTDLLETGGLGAGLSSRCVFGAVLVGLQFTFYDAAKSAFQVAPSDLTLFLDALSGLPSTPFLEIK